MRAPLSSRPGHPVWLIPSLLAAWTVASFYSILSHQFVGWDDNAYAYDNPHIRGLSLENLGWMFSAFEMGHYHPLTWLSLAIDYSFWELDPRGYLITNLALHTASGLLLYLLWRLVRPWVAEETPAAEWLGALAVAVFLVHPLRVEAVAWVSDRKELLASVFCLASVTAYVWGVTRSDRPLRWILLSGGFFVLSMLSKATAVGLPILLVALDLLLFRRDVRLVRLIGEKSIHWAAMGAMLVIAPMAQGSFGAAIALERYPLSSRLAQAAYNLCFHPWKTLWPSGLCCLYPLKAPLQPLAPQFEIAAVIVVLVALAVGWVALARKAYWPAFFLAGYLMFVLPVSGLWQSGAQLVADRYSYFPAMLLTLATAGIPAAWLAWAWSGTGRRWCTACAAAVLLAALWFTTTSQAETWANSETLWHRALTCDQENSAAWNNLGQHYRLQGDLERAHTCQARAVELDPQPSYLINLGSLEAVSGNTPRAAELYRQAIAANATFYEAHFNLANLLAREGKMADALSHYADAWKLAPRVYEIGANYARALLVLERPGEAAAVYRAAIELAPGRAIAWEGLGGALLSTGDLPGAVEALTKAGALPDATPHGALLLAKVHERRGNVAIAERVLAEATHRWPAHTGPHREMASRLRQAERR